MAKDKTKVVVDNGPMGYVLFVAWIGAFLFFLQTTGFFYALLKSIVWPAYLIFYLFESLRVV